jgi:hypothetical protein
MLRRYLLFIYSYGYANGGWNDFVGDFQDLEEAQKHAIEEYKCGSQKNLWTHYHIYDQKRMEIVAGIDN